MTRMIYTVVLVLLFLSCSLGLRAQELSSERDSLSFEILLTDNMFRDIEIKGDFIRSFDITSERLILLSTIDQYYLLGWGGLVPLGGKVTGEISSFAFTSDGFLMTIRGSELCYFDSLGKLSVLYNLPSEGMGISAGKDVMYLFDSNKGQKIHALYALAKGGKYLKLLEVPDPITSVVEMNESVLFASGNRLYSVKPGTRDVQVLAETKNKEPIESVAVDTVAATVYFTTRNTVYAIKNHKVGAITNELGGRIGYLNGLIIFNPENKLMMRIVGLNGTLTGNPQPVVAPAEPVKAVEVLTNSSIIELVRNNLSGNLIISIIRRSKVNFDLSVDAIIGLSAQGVSSDVILEMRQAMKRQSSHVPVK